jgi:copper(I)-binding protein
MTPRALFIIALTLISSASGASDTLIISDAWVRATPPGKMMTAGYASLENVSKNVITITGVSAEIAGHASFHETRIERDRSTMRPVAQLLIKAGERISLKPGGLHIMLMKLSESLSDGQSIDICLELENNENLCSAFSVAKHRKAAHHH